MELHIKHRRTGIARLANQRGITFAEVSTSVLMLSVLAASTTPIFSQILSMYHLRGATQAVYAELQRARLAAVMENNRYRVSVVDGSPVYKIHDDKNHNDLEDDGEVTIKTLELEDPGITLLGQDTVTFLPNGTALTSGTISVLSSSGRMKTLTVGTGGRIRIE